MKTLEQAKHAVQTRHRYLAELGYKIKMGHLYELEAKENDFPNWDTLIALTKSEAELEAEDETVGAYQEQFKTALYRLWEFFPAADLDCIVTEEDLPILEALEEAIGNAHRVMSPQATSLIAALKSIPADDVTEIAAIACDLDKELFKEGQRLGFWKNEIDPNKYPGSIYAILSESSSIPGFKTVKEAFVRYELDLATQHSLEQSEMRINHMAIAGWSGKYDPKELEKLFPEEDDTED